MDCYSTGTFRYAEEKHLETFYGSSSQIELQWKWVATTVRTVWSGQIHMSSLPKSPISLQYTVVILGH